MTATLRGDSLAAVLAALPDQLANNVLRGAMRAGATAVAEIARENCHSAEVAQDIKVSTRVEPGVVSAKVQVKGLHAYIGWFMEWGTAPHFISVDPEQSGGRTARRVNRLAKKGVLVINGRPVGQTVYHPGAKPTPFMRPAADAGEQPAVSAIGGYIAAWLTKEGLAAPVSTEADDDDGG